MPTNTIAENLELLQEATEAIAQAITDAGGTVGSDDGLVHLAFDIATIPNGNSNTAYEYGMADNWMQWIETLTIPEGVTSITGATFSARPEYLTTLKIPSTVTSIQDYILVSFNYLTTIIVNQPEDSIAGAPWGAANATVTWTG